MNPNGQKEVTEKLQAFTESIFGFALKRVRRREEAEDLAQEIFLQLVKSISSGVEILNLEAYVWTVARFTWVQWLKKRAQALHPIEINGLSERIADCEPSPSERLLQEEAYHILRREISFLSNLHRRILVMFYYEGLKQSEIANHLNISVGTIKWHLHDAKQKLKKGLERVREVGMLSVNPIRLSGTGHSGSPGERGETNDFLGRSLAQNIVYAAYHKPISVMEIAQELNMPPSLLEDEVAHLADYAFLVETSSGKYQSNTIIWNTTTEQAEAAHRLYQTCAAEIAKEHCQALLDARTEVDEAGIYYPDDDYNFLLWTLLPKNIEEQAAHCGAVTSDFNKVAPRRNDGGHYIAFGHLEKKMELSFDPKFYDYCGAMNRMQDGSPLHLWQMNTYWSDRPDWRFVHFRDVEVCHSFWQKELADNERNREEYVFLLQKEYIRKNADGYLFNAVWIDSKETLHQLNAAMPDLKQIYEPAISTLYEALVKLTMKNQPKHLQPQITQMVKSNICGGTLVTYMLKHLVDNGTLREPLPHQRKTITTWMGPVR